MIVYKQEIADGIGEMVKAQASVTYTTAAKPMNIIDEKMKDRIYRSVAAKGQTDLFPLDTILATVCENLNGDIFTKNEAWAARHTAEDKPFNLRHVQTDIIGHMTANFVVDDKYNLVPDNSSLDEVPDKFHILTSAVIYKFWEDENRSQVIAKIIDEIQEGKWFVSMECLFSDFDYGLTSPDGEKRIIARTEESSFLTKHLRQYGGKGFYNGHSIGRVLKNITFCGKGLVEQPANPESIILIDGPEFKSTVAGLGYITSSKSQDQPGESDMNEAELKAALAAAEKKNADLTEQLSAANLKKYTDQITDLTTKLEASDKKAADEKKKADDKDEEAKDSLDKMKKDGDDSKAAIADLTDKLSAATAEVANLHKEKRTQERVALAVTKGAKAEEAGEFATKHADKTDEDFAEVLSYAEYKWNSAKPSAVTAQQTIAAVTEPEPELVITEDKDSDFVKMEDVIRAALKKEGK